MKRLPLFFKKYFWDINPQDINPEKVNFYLIGRIMEYGDDRAVKWMRKNFRKNELIESLKSYPGFLPKSANFWALILKVPKSEVSYWKEFPLKISKIIWPPDPALQKKEEIRQKMGVLHYDAKRRLCKWVK